MSSCICTELQHRRIRLSRLYTPLPPSHASPALIRPSRPLSPLPPSHASPALTRLSPPHHEKTAMASRKNREALIIHSRALFPSRRRSSDQRRPCYLLLLLLLHGLFSHEVIFLPGFTFYYLAKGCKRSARVPLLPRCSCDVM